MKRTNGERDNVVRDAIVFLGTHNAQRLRTIPRLCGPRGRF